jgi:hypothetical protein
VNSLLDVLRPRRAPPPKGARLVSFGISVQHGWPEAISELHKEKQREHFRKNPRKKRSE